MTMGWSHFLQGKLIKDWVDVFNEERRDKGKKDDDRIMVKVITEITSFNLNLWRSRCTHVFWGTKIHRLRKMRERLLAQVKDLVKDRSVLTTNGKDHIAGALEENSRLCDISTWIRNTWALYQQTKKKQKVHSTHRITVYF